MAKYVNKSGGMLVLPSGEQIRPDGEAEIDGETAKNAGVAGWIKDGSLVKPADARKIEKAEDERGG